MSKKKSFLQAHAKYIEQPMAGEIGNTKMGKL